MKNLRMSKEDKKSMIPPLTSANSQIVGQQSTGSFDKRFSIPISFSAINQKHMQLTPHQEVQNFQKSVVEPPPTPNNDLPNRIKELDRQLFIAKQENDDLRINLKINKESLQNLIQQQVPQESALIKTINVISSENIRLQMQLERLKQENDNLKTMMVLYLLLIIQTGRAHGYQESPDMVKKNVSKELDSQSRKDTNAKSSSKNIDSNIFRFEFNQVLAQSSGDNGQQFLFSKNQPIQQIKIIQNKQHEEKANQFCSQCKSTTDNKRQKDPREQMSFQRDEAFKENERTIKKLMMEVSKYQSFLKSLLENYSLPENLMEDIKEIVYEDELTHYDNNNEFFAQMPLSPISTSSLSSVHKYQVSMGANMFKQSKREKGTPQQNLFNNRGKQMQQKQPPSNIPKLDFSKLQLDDSYQNMNINYNQNNNNLYNNSKKATPQIQQQQQQQLTYEQMQNMKCQQNPTNLGVYANPKHKFVNLNMNQPNNALALFQAAENLKTENQLSDSGFQLNDSNLLDDRDLQDFEKRFNGGQKYDDLISAGRQDSNLQQTPNEDDLKYFDDNDHDNYDQYKSENTNGFNYNQQNILGMTNTIDLDGSREFQKDQNTSFISNGQDLDINQ
ncbi:UNKNOWN [Stylonychia lemnae]|uniref:Uncharacterized protein n=1 Tax=Stylonychia lemnae TaxID=5949 RepID=A0A078BBR6_STYLE|nr:UNKNOWN [Stylonychia lemnae]|eukprot:CDW91028.1 UNKNOWN [Stylonychia lemnae]